MELHPKVHLQKEKQVRTSQLHLPNHGHLSEPTLTAENEAPHPTPAGEYSLRVL